MRNRTRAESYAACVALSGQELFDEGGKTKRKLSVEGLEKTKYRGILEGKEEACRSRSLVPAAATGSAAASAIGLEAAAATGSSEKEF